MAKQQKSMPVQTALIGLIGSILTVCGGLCGALVTSAVTIYQVERENQQVALNSSGGEQSLTIDTGSIFISRQEAAALDPETYYIDFEQAFILRRPLPGWDPMEAMTLEEQTNESNIPCSVACDQPVYRIRYGQPIEIESDPDTTINGQPIPQAVLDLSQQLYGPPPWKVPSYSQAILNIFDKNVVEPLGIDNVSELMIFITQYQGGRHNRLVAREGSSFIILQGSSTYDGVRIAGVPGTMTLDDWMLFADAEDAYYVVEIAYTTRSGQPLQVWDDLQTYIQEFRVIK